MPKRNILLEKSFTFALLTVTIYKDLNQNREYVLSKQFLRSGTSIGANIREAQNAESKKDFVHKLSIAQKECDETSYWLELLYHSNFLQSECYSDAKSKSEELLRMLKSIIITTRRNMNSVRAIHNS